MCLNHVPGDEVLTVSLCRMSWEAKQRVIVPNNPLPERPEFYEEIKAVVWPKPDH